MSENSIAVTTGVGKNIHTIDRTVASILVQDQVVIPGLFPFDTFIASAAAVSAANAGDDMLQLMAASSMHLHVVRVRVEQMAPVGTAAYTDLQLLRITTAGTLGTAVTPTKLNNGSAATGVGMSGILNANRGTAGASIFQRAIEPIQTAPAGGGPTPFWEWTKSEYGSAIVIPGGGSNGIAIRNGHARASLTLNVEIEFFEATYL